MGRIGSNHIQVVARISLVAMAALLVANCSASKIDPRYGVAASPRVIPDGQQVPKGNGRYHVGQPYVVAGVTYIPAHNPGYRAEGLASWYGDAFHGRLTANGEVFDMKSITAAHPTLPLPSYVRVTNLANHKSMIVRVNDRGPFHANRVIDVSSRASELLGFRSHGVARVRVEYVGPASVKGSDDQMLVATLRNNGQPAPSPSSVMMASAERDFVPDAAPRPVPQANPARIPETPQRTYRVASANAWSAPPASKQAPARAAPVQAAAPAVTAPATPIVRAGFNATPPVQATTSFSPASVTGRGLY